MSGRKITVIHKGHPETSLPYLKNSLKTLLILTNLIYWRNTNKGSTTHDLNLSLHTLVVATRGRQWHEDAGAIISLFSLAVRHLWRSTSSYISVLVIVWLKKKFSGCYAAVALMSIKYCLLRRNQWSSMARWVGFVCRTASRWVFGGSRMIVFYNWMSFHGNRTHGHESSCGWTNSLWISHVLKNYLALLG